MTQRIVAINGVAGSGKDEGARVLVKAHDFVSVALADPLKRFLMDVYHFSEKQLWGPSVLRNQPDKRYLTYHSAEHTLITRGSTTHVWCTRCHQEFLKDESVPSPCEVFLTPRVALQQLGNEWGRGLYKDTWIDYTLRVANTLKLGNYLYQRTRGLVPLRETLSLSLPAINVVVPDVRYINEFEKLKAAGALTIRVKRPGAGLGGDLGMHASEREQLEIPDDAFHHVIQNDQEVSVLHATIEKAIESFDFG